MNESNFQKISNLMLEWYHNQKRDLPWRKTKDPYAIWVSEIMCQQTRVDTVIAYYQRWMQVLPNLEALSNCDDEVLYKLWQGLGYYTRVRNMKKAAQEIVCIFGGQFPTTKEALMGLPGIGDYTASAIASIAFDSRVAAIDGNVLRVMSRLLALEESISKKQTKDAIKGLVTSFLPLEDIGAFNQSLMELGALVCIPNGRPKCEVCPLQDLCQAYKENKQQAYPITDSKQKKRTEKITVFLIWGPNGWLIRKRNPTGLLSNLWEYLNTENKLSELEAKEYLESLLFTVQSIHPIGEVRHVFTHLVWEMTAYLVKVDQEVSKLGIFVSKDEILNTFSIPTAFQQLTNIIKEK